MLIDMLAHIFCTFIGAFFAISLMLVLETMRDNSNHKNKQKKLEEKWSKEFDARQVKK